MVEGDEREANYEQTQAKSTVSKRDAPDPESLYPAHNISLPVDHFPNETKYEPHSNDTFPNRYWFDTTYYQPGGPVTILQSGETDATGRLTFMQKGILKMISQATGGISVVLEHRYYGESFPTKDLSTENLRFLTTEQALADQVYFARNVKFPGMEDQDLTSGTTPYLAYGGSYAGAFVAILRVKYPKVFWGAISSSGVTKAIYDFWEYFAPVAEYGPPICIATQKQFTSIVDEILIGQNDSSLTAELKSAFGMPNVTDVRDFANQLSGGIGWWQSLNWNPEQSSPEFYNYCNNITSYDVIYPGTEAKRDAAASLIKAAGQEAPDYLVNQMLNYIGYINASAVSSCDTANQDECFSNLNATFYEQHTLEDYSWRSWAYQYCSEWGYLQVGSSWPADSQGVISRTIDIPYASFICQAAFGIEKESDVELVNRYGGYDIAAERLAIIDGEFDPWRPATPHAYGKNALYQTPERPTDFPQTKAPAPATTPSPSPSTSSPWPCTTTTRTASSPTRPRLSCRLRRWRRRSATLSFLRSSGWRTGRRSMGNGMRMTAGCSCLRRWKNDVVLTIITNPFVSGQACYSHPNSSIHIISSVHLAAGFALQSRLVHHEGSIIR